MNKKIYDESCKKTHFCNEKIMNEFAEKIRESLKSIEIEELESIEVNKSRSYANHTLCCAFDECIRFIVSVLLFPKKGGNTPGM